MTPDQQFWWNWAVNVALAVATFGAVLVALFGNILRDLIPPKFHLSLVRREGEKTELKDGTGNFIDDVRYYHLHILNERRWITAEEVQAFLIRIDEPGPDGQLQTTWTGTVPIRWRNQEVVPLTRTMGAAADLDLVRVERKNGLFLMPLIVPHNLNAHRHGPCRFALYLQVCSRQADSRIHFIDIAWDGLWEDGDTEMARHVRVGEPVEVRPPEPLPEY